MNWGMLILQILGTIIPLLAVIYANKESAKKENDRRHEQNTEKLNSIIMAHEYLPPHAHSEISGPLHAEGIIRKRNSLR